MTKIAINGYGRIGRNIVRVLKDRGHQGLELCHGLAGGGRQLRAGPGDVLPLLLQGLDHGSNLLGLHRTGRRAEAVQVEQVGGRVGHPGIVTPPRIAGSPFTEGPCSS